MASNSDSSSGSFFQGLMQRFKRIQFGAKAQQAFLEDFAVLIEDGIPANRAVEMMQRVTTGISKEVAISISQRITAGQLLADGMKGWFSNTVVEIIRAGETSGALEETVRSAVGSLGQSNSVIGAVIGALVYPVTVIAAASAVIVYLNRSVFGTFKQIKPNIAQWPDSGQDLIAIADLIDHWWWLLLLTIAVFIFFMSYLLKNYAGGFRATLDKMPIFSIYRRLVAARFLETLGLLIANGVVLKAAIKVMQFGASPYLISHVLQMEYNLGKGKENVADVLDTGLVEENEILRLRVVAEVKGVEHAMVRLGKLGAAMASKTIQKTAKIFGGVLLVVGAVLVVIVVRGIYETGMYMGS